MDETLVQHVTAGEADKAELILKEIFAVLRKQKYIQRSHIYMFSLQLLNTLIKLMVELEIPENEIFVNAGGFGALCSKLMQVRKETECVTVFVKL